MLLCAKVVGVALYGSVVAIGLVARLRSAMLGYEPLRGQVLPGIARLAEAERRVRVGR